MCKITHKLEAISRIISPIALALALSSCMIIPSVLRTSQSDITTPALESSTFYLLKAEDSTGKRKVDWYLLALKALIKEKQFVQSDVLISHLSKLMLTQLQLSEWQLNRAKLIQQKGQPQIAIDNLNFSPSWQLPNLQYKRYYLLEAELYQTVGNLPSSLLSYTEAYPYLAETFEKEQNCERVWALLLQMKPNELKELAEHSNKILSAWVKLMILLHQYDGRPAEQQYALNTWLIENRGLPTNQYLPKNLKRLQAMNIIRPERIAILLPLSEQFSAQGETIRNGFIQALLDNKNSENPATMFYDTNAMSMTEIVSKMKSNGVQFVIGPLQKDKLDSFLIASQHAYPTLALNIPQDATIKTNVCFFTLSPEQEAEQAALHIAQNQHRYPLIIAEDNQFGHRVSEAFSRKWQEITGHTAEKAFFKNLATMHKTVQQVFGLTESQSRIQQLRQILDLDIEAEQRSRRDIDAVYLIANTSELTLLKPFIEVAINPNVKPPKLYASSRSNNRLNGVDKVGELNGIEFSEMPLLVKKDHPIFVRFHQMWPELGNGMTRLYALGMDAYSLIEALPQMQIFPEYRFEGQSGMLSLGDNCIVHRTVSWVMHGD
ncbi:penicillin-binding protein activator [Candidatus Enterovibrio escicola]|uniref:penicillin-binding protein activator n=2 Tax=Candidatus Enterovibrio escicola TaxID=1927127 RepID=UPI001CC233E5|nr:penicillin-binding protein activator [Candidatus Enterovibrio escacola]